MLDFFQVESIQLILYKCISVRNNPEFSSRWSTIGFVGWKSCKFCPKVLQFIVRFLQSCGIYNFCGICNSPLFKGGPRGLRKSTETRKLANFLAFPWRKTEKWLKVDGYGNGNFSKLRRKKTENRKWHRLNTETEINFCNFLGQNINFER